MTVQETDNLVALQRLKIFTLVLPTLSNKTSKMIEINK